MEPQTTALFVVFVATALIGVISWVLGRRLHKANPIGSHYLRLLGQWLFWVGLAALVIAGCFYVGALFNRRFWLYLMLVLIYIVVFYALFFYFRRYPELERIQDEQRRREKKYVPASHSLGKWGSTNQRRGQGKDRRASQ